MGQAETLKEVLRDRVGDPEELAALVDEAGELAVLPQVVAKVLELSAEQNSYAGDFEKAISVDPGFTGRVLKLANSAYYGLPRRVSGIRDAVVLLGIREVRCLALAATGFELFVGRSDQASLQRRQMWRHAVYAGAAARSLSRRIAAVQEEEAFVAGLLHDIGKVISMQVMREEFLRAAAFAEEQGLSLWEVERERLPYAHPEMGAAALAKWNLPCELVEAVACHHEPRRALRAPALAATTAAANAIAHFLASQEGDSDAELIEDISEMQIPSEALEMLGIEPAEVFRSVVECAGHLSEAAALYSMAA